LALVKSVGVSIFFCLLDVAAPSHGLRNAGLTIAHVGECVARVVAFDNLDNDSSSPLRLKGLGRNVQLIRYRHLVSFCVVASPCYHGP
jgi:hypothetical protein